MTAITLNGCDEKTPLSGHDRINAAPTAPRPLGLRILECLAIIAAPLAMVAFTVTAMVQFG
ncbi:MAG TPA: hypothetical protein VMU06_00250 [Stellaceae bacterium]|nr:hypothetical protein [Stellaceae bacterium]